MTKRTGTIPRRPLGTTGADVSAVGLGGYHLGSARTPREATRIVHAALDAGIDFFDNAWEYHEGESEKRLGAALEGRRHQAFLMTKVCTHGRDAKVAMKQLEQSLKRLKTDYLDLWQIHEVVWEDDPEHHFAKGGVIEALDRAKKEGKVRFTGFTGHKSPQIHRKMLDQGYPFDTCQLPLNCFDASFRSFEEEILPLLNERGIAPIGMKSLGGTGMPEKEIDHRPGGNPLRDEPSDCDIGQRDRIDEGPRAERCDRSRFQTDDRPRDEATAKEGRRRCEGGTFRALQDLDAA